MSLTDGEYWEAVCYEFSLLSDCDFRPSMHGNDDWLEGGCRYAGDCGIYSMDCEEADHETKGFGESHAGALERALTLSKQGPVPEYEI